MNYKLTPWGLKDLDDLSKSIEFLGFEFYSMTASEKKRRLRAVCENGHRIGMRPEFKGISRAIWHKNCLELVGADGKRQYLCWVDLGKLSCRELKAVLDASAVS